MHSTAKGGESVQQHIKAMTEVFDSLAVIGDPVDEEDRVVHLLASLSESFNMLVTHAFEANPEVPKWKRSRNACSMRSAR